MTSPYNAPTLRGILLRDEGDKVIVQATASEVKNFGQKPGAPVWLRPPAPDVLMRFKKQGVPRVGWGDREDIAYIDPMKPLYNEKGEPVAMIRQATMEADRVDVTTFGDHARQTYISGAYTVIIEAVGLPNARLL